MAGARASPWTSGDSGLEARWSRQATTSRRTTAESRSWPWASAKWSRNRARCKAMLPATSTERTPQTAASRYRLAHSSIESAAPRGPIGTGTTFREGNLRRSGRCWGSAGGSITPRRYRFPSQKRPSLKGSGVPRPCRTHRLSGAKRCSGASLGSLFLGAPSWRGRRPRWPSSFCTAGSGSSSGSGPAPSPGCPAVALTRSRTGTPPPIRMLSLDRPTGRRYVRALIAVTGSPAIVPAQVRETVNPLATSTSCSGSGRQSTDRGQRRCAAR